MTQTTEILNMAFAHVDVQEYEHRAIIINEHEVRPPLYCLLSGYVRQYVTTQTGEELTIHIYKPGSVFPLVNYLAETNNRYAFQALGEVTVKTGNPEQVMESLQHEPAVLLDLTENLSRGLLGLSTRLEHTLFSNAYMKVASLIGYLHRAFAEGDGEFTALAVPFTHQDLANWLGLARETVSRQIEQLQNEKYVRYKGNTLLVNGKKLHHMLDV